MSDRREGVLGGGTQFETTFVVQDSGIEGPTVFVVGGMHGNEPAGIRAARQISNWTVARGRLVVVPVANVRAFEAGIRRIPGLAGDEGDLNRHFPHLKDDGEPKSAAARQLWAFVRSVRPDVLIDLHEGYGFRAAGSKSVGSTVITHRREDDEVQRVLLEKVNESIDNPERTFLPLRSAVAGSLARAASEILGIEAHIFETTTAEQDLSTRVRQHRVLLAARLALLEMADGTAGRMVAPDLAVFQVAVYDGSGTGGDGQARRIEEQLSDMRVVRIGAEDIRSASLLDFDAVIFPGGSGSAQGNGLTAVGRDAVRKFVRDGGGYIGICAGSYLALNNYKWGLGLVPMDSFDRKHWRRGKGMVEIELSPEGLDIFGRDRAEVSIRFAQGPLMHPSTGSDLPPATVLAWYRSGIGENGADPQTMVDTPAVVAGQFGQGRVVLFSPHPELTKGQESLLILALSWTDAKSGSAKGRVTSPIPQAPEKDKIRQP